MTLLEFSSMGCAVVVSGGSPSARAAIRSHFTQMDAIFSRFSATSELCAVNGARGPVVRVSSTFAAAVAVALEAACTSGGLVDPTLGASIEAVGYDTDFRELAPDPRPIEPRPAGNWRAIRVSGRLLVRPAGTVLDLNGVVKALTVDQAASMLDGPGWVSAGGDIATRGTPVTVALPGGGAVSLNEGGIATSGTTARSWWRGGELQHHLIDPTTGTPARSPWREVTAVGRDCLSADVAAKTGFLLGADGPRRLDGRGVAARFVAASGVVETEHWTTSVAREQAWA